MTQNQVKRCTDRNRPHYTQMLELAKDDFLKSNYYTYFMELKAKDTRNKQMRNLSRNIETRKRIKGMSRTENTIYEILKKSLDRING